MGGFSKAAGGVHAVVPVKTLADAKTRLSERYTDEQRRCLVLAMLADTLAAVTQVESIDDVWVVTADAEVATVARHAGARIIAEPDTATSLNDALNFALGVVSGVDVLILQADLPAVTTADVAAFIAASPGHSFVADHHGTGTTALLLKRSEQPPTPQFGVGSAARHDAAGAVLTVGDWPGLRHDVDTPADLDAALELGVGPSTFEALASSAKCLRRS